MKKISNLLLIPAIAVVALLGFGCASTSTTTSSTAVSTPAQTSSAEPPSRPGGPAIAMPATQMPSTPAPATPAVTTTASANKPALKFVKVDSEETAGENGAGSNAVDGDTSTMWHTQWQDANPPCPHEITIELVPPTAIKGFTYLPRQDDSDHGQIKDYEFYVSDDGVDFGQPVSKGTWENTKDLKTATFEAKKCRFIKLKALSEVNDEAWTSAAEINVVPAN